MEIPNARIIDDGVARAGYAEARPYKWFTGTMGVFPGLEFSFRLTEITNIESGLSEDYGSDKDKAFDLKYQVLPESKYFPALSLGLHDFHGTRKFQAEYITANRQIYPFDFTLGWGTDRLKGFFGGIEWAVTDNVHFMTEYNPIDYKKDRPSGGKIAVPEGADTPFNIGLRFMPISGLDLGVSYQRGNKLGFMARYELDVGKELMPKRPDPMYWGKYAPVKETGQPRNLENTREWLQDIKDEIEKIGMHDVAVELADDTLTVNCQNIKYLSNQKAVGRIFRIMLFASPQYVTTLEVVLTRRDLPILSASVKRDHFKSFVFGEIDEATLDRLIRVRAVRKKQKKEGMNSDAVSGASVAVKQETTPSDLPEKQTLSLAGTEAILPDEPFTAPSADRITAASDQTVIFDWGIKPTLDLYLNDPSGFFKFRIGASPYASVSLWEGNLIGARVFIPFYSDIESSNTTVPDPVRSDSWKYMDESINFERLEIGQAIKLARKTYGLISLGYFESMYAGLAGEILTFIGSGDLAIGFKYDYAVKRKPDTGFELTDFKRQTFVGNFYYDIKPLDLNFHAQYGKFLAEDIGWRLVLTRSFDNGVDIGGWYSFTDTDDLTGYNKDYHDKGVFISIPVRMLSRVEKRSKYAYAISPWTRDVAQTVYHRQNLYGIAGDLMPGVFRSDLHMIGE